MVSIEVKNKEVLKDSILQATKNMALKDGWTSVSMRKLADAIGYTAPTIYEHFANKDALLYEFVKEGVQDLSHQINLAVKSEGIPKEQLFKAAIAYWSFAHEHPTTYKLIFNLEGAIKNMPEDTSEIDLLEDTIRPILQKVLRDGDNPKDYFLNWWSIVHGYVCLSFSGKVGYPVDDFEKLLEKALVRFISKI